MAPGFPSLSDSLALLGCLLIVTKSGAQNPVVTVTNSGNVDVFRTATANLSCSFVSTVPLTVYTVSWYKLNDDGTPGAPFLVYIPSSTISEDTNRLAELGLTGRVSFLPDSTSIAIQETAQPDTGTFRCKVDPIFPGGGVASSVDTNLTVVVLPRVTIAQLPLIANVQEDVTLTCQSGSFPVSTYTWTRVDGATLPGGATFYEGYQLVIPRAVLSDAGEYRCVADNGYGTDTGTYLLTLHDGLTSVATQERQSSGELTTTKATTGQDNTHHLPDGSCFGAGTVAGAAVGCHVAGVLLGVALTLLVLRSRNAQKDASHDEGYEDVRTPNRAASQDPGNGDDDYEIPMEAQVSLSQPPSGHYQELQPAVYQSLQKN
ncbi:immunoglobulin superfamily member 11-like [Branchiostoma lanceolatum]|uniref:immunoglobulin superfamily member 11-like n=1 Tax=Branchiostoma lanceolatum TaxID=7740 RepID=UPI003452F57D